MTLKFSKTPARTKPKSPKQKRQWALFAALGYSMAIRGYLLCWDGLLKQAGYATSDPVRNSISVTLAWSREAERELRRLLKRI